MTLVRSSNTISDQKELENYWASVYLDGDRFDSAEDGIIVTDAGGAIRFSNNTAEHVVYAYPSILLSLMNLQAERSRTRSPVVWIQTAQ